MTFTVALFVLLAAPNVEASLAPDQPIPYIFVDDPLVLQLVSDQDAVVTGHITITGSDAKPKQIDFPTINLRAKGTHWQTMEGAPAQRGKYQARLSLVIGKVPLEQTLTYCRIDRPNAKASAPLGIHLATADDKTLSALQGIPARVIYLNAEMPDFDARADAITKSGSLVTVVLDSARIPNAAERGEALAHSLGDKASGWAVATDGPATFQNVAEAVRRGGSRSPIVPIVKNAAEVTALLANGAGKYITSAALHSDAPTSAQFDAIRDAAEAAGFERFPISVLGQGVDVLSEKAGSEMVHNLMASLASGATQCVLEPTLVFNQNGFGDGYVFLTAFVNRLSGAQYVGSLEMAADSHAEVFRVGDMWTVVLWSKDASVQTSIGIGNATDLALADACNNPLPPPEKGNGTVSVWIDREPRYLSGHGGDVIAKAARNMARQEAQRFLASKAFQQALPKDLMEIMKTISTSKAGRPDRLYFFAVLRMFPVLEQMWHDGLLKGEVAAPAMASMSRLIRDLCILEQEAGQPFIEVLQATLDRCGEYQSQYLTGSGENGTSHERGDWLLSEVGRLMTESKQLLEQGRTIEATGVATLGEWRARSLEFAVKAVPRSTPAAAPAAPAATPAPAAKAKAPAAPKK